MKKQETEEGKKPVNKSRTNKQTQNRKTNAKGEEIKRERKQTQTRRQTTKKGTSMPEGKQVQQRTRAKREAKRIDEMTRQIQKATQKQENNYIEVDMPINPQNRRTRREHQERPLQKRDTQTKREIKTTAEEKSVQNRKPRTKRELQEMGERDERARKPKTKREVKEQKRQDKKQEKKRKKQEKKERRKRSVIWKIFKTLLVLALIGVIAYSCYFVYRMNKNGGGLQGFMATALGHDENTLKDLDPIHFLLVGISGGDENYKLADTIMVCSYNPKTQKASILSIPRDTYVGKDKTKANASYKINAVYRNGENIEGMVNHIEELTELEIDNYLVIDTKALVQLVDALGGVTFDVPIDMDYDDPSQDLYIHLKAGVQKLDGKQAEGLVRFRHSNDLSTYPAEYGDNDIGRMRTQREFITQVMKQTVRPENLLKLIQIAEIGFNNITTNMTFDTVKDYLPYAVNFNPEELQTGTLPGEAELANKVWIYTPNLKQTKKLVEELFIEERPLEEEEDESNTNTIGNTVVGGTTTHQEETIKIELLNGSGNTKNLTKAIERLEEKGYEIVKKGDTKTTTKTSIINRSNREDSVSKKLKQTLKYGTISKKYNNSQVDYTIILGKDYK